MARLKPMTGKRQGNGVARKDVVKAKYGKAKAKGGGAKPGDLEKWQWLMDPSQVTEAGVHAVDGLPAGEELLHGLSGAPAGRPGLAGEGYLGSGVGRYRLDQLRGEVRSIDSQGLHGGGTLAREQSIHG